MGTASLHAKPKRRCYVTAVDFVNCFIPAFYNMAISGVVEVDAPTILNVLGFKRKSLERNFPARWCVAALHSICGKYVGTGMYFLCNPCRIFAT